MNKTVFPFRYYLSAVLVFGFLGLMAYQLWLAWPQILLGSIKWQREINAELSDLLYDAKENSLAAGISLAGLSFFYGILHSVGPGHGKVIVTTFLATHPSKIKHGLILTALSAFMQAIVATVLVSALVLVFSQSMRDVSSKADYLINASFLAMSLLGITILWRTSKAIYHYLKHHKFSIGCHCCHCVSGSQLNQTMNWRSYTGIIISIGIRPCSGAILVLLFSNVVGIYWLGIVSAFLMAIGTAITTSTIALMTISGKKIIQRYLRAGNHQHASLGSMGLQFVGGILLTLLGIILYSSQTYSMSPIF